MVKKNKQKQIYIFSLIIILLLTLITYTMSRLYPRQNPQNSITDITTPETSTPPTSLSPSPIPLTKGPGIYTVSHQKSSGPNISEVIFDPLDVQKNNSLTITVTLSSNTDIQSVTGSLTTDNQKINLVFSQKSTENTRQKWSTTITLPDTVLYKYILTIVGTNTTGDTEVVVAPRS